MAGGTDLLRVEDLEIVFSIHGGAIQAVRNASFRILPGKVTALVGESGSGKSVIAQAVMGILPAPASITNGRIVYTEPMANVPPVDIAQLPRDGEQIRQLRGSRMSMIFQEPMTSLSPLHTIGDQIGEMLQTHQRVSKAEEKERTAEMLGLVGFPNPARAYSMYPFELSGGLRQRAMIAMALICRPALLIADEPTTALDVTIQAQILQLLRELQSKLNMAMLLITHDLGVVANIADEVVVIYHGEIMEAGSVADIFRRPGHVYLQSLLAAVPHFEMKPGERLRALREIPVDTSSMPGWKTPAANSGSGPILAVRGLTKSFTTRKSGWFGRNASNRVLAVDNVSFDVRRGECLGLVGESGCGKTTVSKIIMQALRPDAGAVQFSGSGGSVDVLAAHGEELLALRSKIQMVFQDPVSSLSPRMTVQSILSEPLEIHGKGDSQSRLETVKSLMRVVNLDPRFLSRYPHSFSGGQRQRIGIARALALQPELLICDEPVSALDVSVQAQILNLLKDLQRQLGLTYIFISHNLAVVNYMADRIAVMCGGQIVELAPREMIFGAAVHPYTRALLAAVPFPDLERPLDFAVLESLAASGSNEWAAQFRGGDGEGALTQVDLGDGHMVLARPTADVKDLRAW